MGASSVLRGEYLVRLRVNARELRDPPPPRILYEDARHPRVRELRELVPARIRAIRDPFQQVLTLRTWVARAWTYEAFGSIYAPWDPATVLAWTRGGWGHGRPRPIAMCVHYGMVFATLASALGHAARGLAITENINGPNGHFMTEIWDRDRGRWVAHDPNFDLHYRDGGGSRSGGEPMSGVELADAARAGTLTGSAMVRGGGFRSDCPRLNGLLRSKLATGKSFAAVGVWRCNDVISRPASAPPSHGSVIYCETDLVWYAPASAPVAAAMGMFPYRTTSRGYFAAPPPPRTSSPSPASSLRTAGLRRARP
jgi:hypothetical protein